MALKIPHEAPRAEGTCLLVVTHTLTSLSVCRHVFVMAHPSETRFALVLPGVQITTASREDKRVDSSDARNCTSIVRTPDMVSFHSR